MGSSAAKDYLQAAQSRGSRFISIILTCEAAENERRLRSADRGGPNNTKLTDIGILREIRESEDLYHFGGQDELELDVSAMSASETAKAIFDFVGKRIRLPDLA
jgi:chloramphenicol 3-O-phosphotransferase